MTDHPGLYELPDDHPGKSDPAYRARRGAISAASAAHTPGGPIADVEYSPEEDAVWEVVSRELKDKHRRLACQQYLEAADRLVLPTTRVPQLAEVDERLGGLTGFRIRPVAGLVPTRQFYGSLADRVFQSTQYIRHHSVPYYTPEPDIVHEIIGHANMLAGDRFADLYEAAGAASRRAESDGALEYFSRVFWFTLEFGVVMEDGRPKAYGAGLLSSYGEIEVFADAEMRPFDIAAMGVMEYDITRYQPALFAAQSFDRMYDELMAFFTGYDEEAFSRSTSQLVR